MATTRSRSRQRSAEIKRFSLSLSIISRMASTWPCGRDFCVVNRSCGETRGSSRSTRRKVSILSGGQSERLATVRLRVFWPSRQASRRRTAGGELRLGTTSMYMGALDHNNYALSSTNMINYMGAYGRSRDGTMHTFPTVYPRIQPLLLLELRVSGFIESVTRGWRHPLVFGSLMVGFGCLVAFVIVEASGAWPMVPLRLFASRSFTGANLLTVFLYAAMDLFFFLFPLNLIQVQAYSATAAGAATLPMILLIFLLSRWSGGLIARYGPRVPLITGPLIAAFGFVLFAAPSVGSSYWNAFSIHVSLLGLGMAITVAPLTTVVMNSADQEPIGAASGIN